MKYFGGSIGGNGYSEVSACFPHEVSESEEVHGDPVVLDGLERDRWLWCLNNRCLDINRLVEMNDSSWLALLNIDSFEWFLVIDSWTSSELFDLITALSAEMIGSTLDAPSVLEGVSFRLFQFCSLHIKS